LVKESVKRSYVLGTVSQISQEMSPDAMQNATATVIAAGENKKERRNRKRNIPSVKYHINLITLL